MRAVRRTNVTEAASHWPALVKWTDDYLADRLGDRRVTVAVTPTGFADAVNDGYFVRPHEERKPFREFLRDLHTGPDVNYVQLQNSNLTAPDEFDVLLADVDREFDFATEALGRAHHTEGRAARGARVRLSLMARRRRPPQTGLGPGPHQAWPPRR